MKCLLCGSTAVEVRDARSALCPDCGLLINLQTRELDYSQGGGQRVPDAAKMKWRIENARLRFRIISRYIDGHELFIDIGCGSGEMLEVSRTYFPNHLGFDTNTALIRHIAQERHLNAIEARFDYALVDERLRNRKKVVALSHVLEHLDRPLDTLQQIYDAMQPGDLLYLEVPLHTGESFRKLGYGWNLWNEEHLALYSMESLRFIARHFGFHVLHEGTRIFARGSKSGKTRLKLFLGSPLKFIATAIGKNPAHSMADAMIADYGCMVLRK